MPITATRLPVRSWRWSHRAVCIVTPAKESTPSMSGSFGTVRMPLALIRKRAVTSPPGSVCTRQTEFSSSNSAAITLVLNRIRERMPYLSTQCSAYALSSRPGAYVRDQSGLCSKENW